MKCVFPAITKKISLKYITVCTFVLVKIEYVVGAQKSSTPSNFLEYTFLIRQFQFPNAVEEITYYFQAFLPSVRRIPFFVLYYYVKTLVLWHCPAAYMYSLQEKRLLLSLPSDKKCSVWRINFLFFSLLYKDMTKNILSLLIGLPKTTKGFKLYVNRKKVKLVSLESDRYLITYVFINKKIALCLFYLWIYWIV